MDPALSQAVTAAVEAGNPNHAIAMLEQALGQYPAHPDAWAKLGEVLFNCDQLDRALQAESQAIHYDPSPARYHARSVTLREAGRRHDELADLSQAVALDPNGTGYRRDRLWLALLLGDLDQALSDAQDNLRLAPDNADYHSDLARVLLQHGRHADALVAMDVAVQRGPARADFRRYKSAILREGGRYREALVEAHAAVALAPDDGRCFRCRALSYAALGDDDSAEEDRSTATRLENQD